MGLKTSLLVRYSFAATFLISNLAAAPRLRLSTAAVGPVSVATGASGTAPSVDAYNAGDGELNPTASGSAAWLAPVVAAGRSCGSGAGTCYAIQIGLETASLSAGMYTGTITVSDPNALDAPQTITVTVQVGGGVPNQVEVWIPPDQSSRDVTFTTNTLLTTRVSTESGVNWLSVTTEGSGSFRFTYPYHVRVTHQADMAEGSYAGSFVTGGSSLSPENRTVPVTMRVTSQPIAKASAERVSVRLAQGAAKQVRRIALANDGMGSLEAGQADAATDNGVAWLSALPTEGTAIPFVIDPAGLDPGAYKGNLTLNSNAANSPLNVRVELQVVPTGAPVAAYGSLKDMATPGAPVLLAPGGMATLAGEQLTMGDPIADTPPPYPTSLGGLRVLVNGQAAALSAVFYDQTVFQVPFGTAAGGAEVRVERDGLTGNGLAADMADRAPRIYGAGSGQYGKVYNSDGTLAMPPNPAFDGSRPARVGENIVIWATGLGATDPAVNTGDAAPEDPPANVTGTTLVTFGGGFSGGSATVAPVSAILAPGLVGIYQVTVTVPGETPLGSAVPVAISVDYALSNAVRIAIDPAPSAQ